MALHQTNRFMLTFSQALEHLKNGLKMQRVGWNGKGMYLFYVEESSYKISPSTKPSHSQVNDLPYAACLFMKTADNKLVPWLASQTDILANDWQTAV